jgi:hypothetical protein
MDKIEIVFKPSILHFELIPLILVTISVITMILITTYIVKKELKEGSKK